ncbi:MULTISPECIES: (2Fe-2S)-binding protein [unclassified Agarivorans]|uniref:(2Fe-2S)-binding protein n=1 Tax=unclassified Agarivorans TaxID=2636026 RepID=UPI0026E379A1|nr:MULTISPECIES: (2Fe-2S)-binding protein [unclassified Agarivorans]MDO6684816.1 (2Fe-2S)-binding protein [Agarivorans sp. 3_MG-2023]MDO6715023.1 (2Fe-2S)-binding protein [Agarivorans sp. 2_MG-2023]MDO6764057.1 (2Fe-2S)-binding protein [Agarivorans sp. 1_MG-2023]
MWVCLCHQINDDAIAKAQREGQDSIKQLKQSLGLGKTCGKCVRLTKQRLISQPKTLITSRILAH